MKDSARKAMWARKNAEMRRSTLEENRRQGKLGEDMYKFQATVRGYEYRRTGIGSDFKERPRSLPWETPQRWRKVDVKTGDAKLSPLQKQNGAKVVRVDPYFGMSSVFRRFSL